MKIYQFRVSIIGIPRVCRVIEITDNRTFDELHDAIFDAFDRYDPHLYSFFITKEDTKNIQSIFNAIEITHPQHVEDTMGSGRKRKSTANTRIEDIDLNDEVDEALLYTGLSKLQNHITNTIEIPIEDRGLTIEQID